MLDVDLLLSRLCNKLDSFVSGSSEPQSFVVDVLVMLWDQFSLIYTFPHLQILPHLLCRVEKESILVIFIAWDWPRRTLYSMSGRLSIGPFGSPGSSVP